MKKKLKTEEKYFNGKLKLSEDVGRIDFFHKMRASSFDNTEKKKKT